MTAPPWLPAVAEATGTRVEEWKRFGAGTWNCASGPGWSISRRWVSCETPAGVLMLDRVGGDRDVDPDPTADVRRMVRALRAMEEPEPDDDGGGL